MGSIADLTVHLGLDDSATSGLDSFADKIDNNIGKITAMGAVAGAAAEGFARKQQVTNVALERMARVTGENSDELRGMAGELQNATFPMGEVVALMETATQRGLRGEAIGEYAKFWDMVGDATGEAGPKLGEMGVALAAVGIAAGDEAEALGAFGFITDHTTSSVGEFLQFLERTGPQLREIGADVDDAAAIMGVLENEMGMAGRTARTEFRKAINESDGTLAGMLDTLGISEGQFEAYTGKVQESSGAIGANAEALAGSMTQMQKISAAAENTMMKYGGLADAASMLAVPLLALGPIMGGVSKLWQVASGQKIASVVATTKATVVAAAVQVKQWAIMGVKSLVAAGKVALAWLIAMGPIALVIAAVVGLVVVIVKNWDAIVKFTKSAWDSIVGWITTNADRIKTIVGTLVRVVLFAMTGGLSELVLAVVRNWDTIVGFFREAPGRILSALSGLGTLLLGVGRDMIQGFLNGIQGMWGNVTGWISKQIDRLPSIVKKALGISSPSKVFAELGRDTIAGFGVGIDDEWSRVEKALGTKTAELPTVVGGGFNGSGLGGMRHVTVNLPDGSRFDGAADDQIVEALLRYQGRNGSIPIRTRA